jgi:ubiquinone/menaquinone biosynthesis C-methylase UbiE
VSEQLALLAESWTQAAEVYEAELVPRFDPWTRDALFQLSQHASGLPPGACVVPMCGPGQELPLVAAVLGPERTLIGIDISPGMVQRAMMRAADVGPHCTARVADAMQPLCDGKLAAILTVFGLQQLPDPVTALKGWCSKLEPAGVAVVCFWPPGSVESHGPWQTYSELLSKRVGASERKQSTSSWDELLAAAAESAGAEVLVDTLLQHEMEWRDGAAIWEGMTRGGPWVFTRLRRGDDFMQELKGEFLQVHPSGTSVRHSPHARLLVLRKRAATSAL